MFGVFTDSKNKFTVNLSKILFFYATKTGTRLEMEDGTVLEVKESYGDVNHLLELHNALYIYENQK